MAEATPELDIKAAETEPAPPAGSAPPAEAASAPAEAAPADQAGEDTETGQEDEAEGGGDGLSTPIISTGVEGPAASDFLPA